ncbi:MAG: restriction endonuclease subunit S [Bacteroidales bacterium]|jgi:type I restriction enzyme S subunit
MEKQKKIPKLRFPEFEGVWEKKTVGELGVFTGGGTPDTAIAKYWQGNIPWISSSDIQEDTVQEYLTSRFITEEAIKKSATKIVPKNSVLIVSRVGIGKFAVSKSPVCTSQDFTSLTPLVDNPYFLAYYFKEKTNLFFRFSQGTSIKGFTGTDIRNMVFKVPSLSEQQKIASFFTAIDQKISQLKRKKTLLEQYKKGVMQRIFSQEIRFKDDNGQEFPKWEKKRLKNIADIIKGEQLNKELLEDQGSYPCINGGIEPSGFTSKYNSMENTITISEGGNSCGFINFIKTKFWCGGHCYKIIIKNEMLNSKLFLFHNLKYNQIKMMKLRVGTGLPNIQKKDISNFVLLVSISIPEQTKIANFLSAIDVKINHTQKQIEKAEVWKKGLMQQMFV